MIGDAEAISAGAALREHRAKPGPADSYRPDVDGLRALAVVPVVLYHAGAGWFRGGFVGVDVFFVISGFLITGVIWRQVSVGRFSLVQFYVRRSKRILPALFAVLSSVALASLVVLGPTDVKRLGHMVIATCAFVSNVALWKDVSYFAPAAELNPLLMTWSLGVEEQFYLLWPLVLLGVFRLGTSVRAALGVALVLSFAAAIWGAVHAPAATFFLLPTRAWELLLGGLLGLEAARATTATTVETPRRRDVASVLGLLAIGLAVALYDARTVFPGLSALLPCGGAGLLIWAGPNAIVNRAILARRPAVFVGLLSYSIYLWHWPILTLLRVVGLGHLRVGPAIGGVFVTAGLSYLTWRFVERPFRASGSGTAAAVLCRYGIATASCAGLGLLLVLADGFPARLDPEAVRLDGARTHGNPKSALCAEQGETLRLPDPRCETHQPLATATVAIWGDSHADALAPGVVDWVRHHGWNVAQVTASGCPPIPGVSVLRGGRSSSACRSFNQRVLDWLLNDQKVRLVILSARWALYAEGTGYGADEGEEYHLTDGRSAELSQANSMRVFRNGLGEVARTLVAAGKRVILVGQVPEMPFNVPDCMMRHYMWPPSSLACELPEGLASERLRSTNDVINELAGSPTGVRAIWPIESLCDHGVCSAQAEGIPFYVDANHLSLSGAERVGGLLDASGPWAF